MSYASSRLRGFCVWRGTNSHGGYPIKISRKYGRQQSKLHAVFLRNMLEQNKRKGVLMRSRNIKPGFFKDDTLAECEPLARILFAGLWCFADREGRFKWRPKRIKAEILPYDNVEITVMLRKLVDIGVLVHYQVDGVEYGQVVNFLKHQRPHHTEKASDIPSLEANGCLTVNSPLNDGKNPPDSLIPDSLIPDSLKESIAPKKTTRKKRASPPPKTKYLDAVLLTDQEYQRLVARYGQEHTNRAVELLNNAIMSKGYKYKSHYHTIIGWPMEEVQDGSNKTTDRWYRTRDPRPQLEQDSDIARALAAREAQRAAAAGNESES